MFPSKAIEKVLMSVPAQQRDYDRGGFAFAAIRRAVLMKDGSSQVRLCAYNSVILDGSASGFVMKSIENADECYAITYDGTL